MISQNEINMRVNFEKKLRYSLVRETNFSKSVRLKFDKIL